MFLKSDVFILMEIALGVRYSCAVVLQGEALFQTHENLEHLAMMERVLGPLPSQMLNKVE